MKRAQEAAAQAAEVARARAQEAAAVANRTAGDPATAETFAKGAREAVGMARRGVTTVIKKIDPSTLAELIIKATALQDLTNKSLRKKGSPYRIAEISISASIPPAVSFASAVSATSRRRSSARWSHRAISSTRRPRRASSCWRSTGPP
jgi:hypothetical protein